MIFGASGRATYARQLQSEIPDQERHGGSRRTQTVEVRFRDASAHQKCLCRRTRDGVTPEEDPTSSKRLSWSQQHGRGRYQANCLPGPQERFLTRYRGLGNDSFWRNILLYINIITLIHNSQLNYTVNSFHFNFKLLR